jgi:hypothetical protein
MLAAALPVWAGAATIEAVVLKPGTSLGIGGSVALAYRPLVLFDDGRYSADPASALSPQPRLDGRWQREGGTYAFTPDAGKPFNVPATLRARPAPRDGRLEGSYRSLGGVGTAGRGVPVVAAAKTLHFAADGTLRSDSTAGATAAGLATSSRGAGAGRYRVAGHTLMLQAADGGSETRLFYLFPDSTRVIGIGGSTYAARQGAP